MLRARIAPDLCPILGGPRREYGDVSGMEFSVQARREEGAYSQRSVTDEQRSLRRKGPPGTSLYLRLGALSREDDVIKKLSIGGHGVKNDKAE
jgi:hypothetical protein